MVQPPSKSHPSPQPGVTRYVVADEQQWTPFHRCPSQLPPHQRTMLHHHHGHACHACCYSATVHHLAGLATHPLHGRVMDLLGFSPEPCEMQDAAHMPRRLMSARRHDRVRTANQSSLLRGGWSTGKTMRLRDSPQRSLHISSNTQDGPQTC